MEKAELKELLKESTEKVLFELGKILDKSSNLYDELIILWKRHDDIEREIRLGTVSFEDASRENNKVTDSLLKLIDKVGKTNEIDFANKIERRKIPVEDAIEWLTNALLGQGYFSQKLTRIIDEVSIFNDGTLLIIMSLKFKGHDDSSSPRLLERKTIFLGKIQDIGAVTVKENFREDYDSIKFTATNRKKAFGLIEYIWSKNMDHQSEEENNKIETEKKFANEFEITVYDFSTKIKNAIDYLAIHFGRKEDAF